MEKFNKTQLQGRSLYLRGAFLLFLAGTLSCTAESELWAAVSADSGSESLAEPVEPIGEPIGELAAEPELFVLLSPDDEGGVIPELALGGMQPMPPLVADRNSGVAAEHVERIRQKTTTQSLALARVNKEAFRENALQLPLSASKKLRASKKHVEALGENHFVWAGEVPGAASMSTFVVHNGEVTGSIRDENNVLYRIEPVGDGVHALTQIDEAGFPPEAKPLTNEMESMDAPFSFGAADTPVALNAGLVEIDVLVAFTPAARRARNDMDALIRLAVEETNQSYRNSGINIRLTLVDSFEFNYTETSDWNRMIVDFRDSSTVKSRRDASGADVAMLIVNQREYCGMAYVYPGAAGAFGLVHYDCATGRYTFGHEIGHIQGASHNEHIESSPVFSYGHGYIYSVAARTNNFSTVMSYDWGAGCNYGCPRIPYWSNPNISYKGTPTGTVNRNNNARVLNETAPRIAAFRTRPGSARPTCTLSSPISSIPQTGGTYAFSATCTGDPSRYTWTVNGQTQSATGRSLSYTFPANTTTSARSFTVAVTATNNAGTSNPAQTTLSQAAAPVVSRPVCSFNASTVQIPSAGGRYSISINCTGSPTSHAWTVNGQRQSATGNTLVYDFPANNTSAARSFTLVVTATNSGGTSNPVQMIAQQPASNLGSRPVCSFSAPTASIPASGGTYSIAVRCTNSPTSHTWTVNGQRQSATGSTLVYTFPANNTTSARSFTILASATNSAGTGNPAQLVVNQPRR